jgi:AcrR family transcriptional regulator
MAEPLASPWGPARGREQQRALKREAVLRTAAQLFNEKGYAASTLDEVAERLGVSKPTVYYYAESKDAILLECVRIGLEMLQTAVRAVDAQGGRAIDKLVAAMRQYAEIATLDFGMCVIRVGEESLPPESRRKVRHMKAGLDREFRELIRLGIEEGSIAPCDPKLAAFTLAGALSWIARWYRPDGPLTPEAIADQCIHVLLLGLCSDATRPEVSAARAALAAAEPPPPARKRASRPRRRG